MHFSKIIEKQTTEENRRMYHQENKKSINSDVLYIEIKNNDIAQKKCSNSQWKQRILAWTQMIADMLAKHSVKDCILKINLSDQPKKGHFNFCRLKNSEGFFLIPNFRFANDNIVNCQYQKWKEDGQKWKDVVNYIKNNDKPFDEKEEKYYFSGGIQGNFRLEYFNYMINNLNTCDGYLWGSDKISKLTKLQNFQNIQNFLNLQNFKSFKKLPNFKNFKNFKKFNSFK